MALPWLFFASDRPQEGLTERRQARSETPRVHHLAEPRFTRRCDGFIGAK
jgi:hypothetical protein